MFGAAVLGQRVAGRYEQPYSSGPADLTRGRSMFLTGASDGRWERVRRGRGVDEKWSQHFSRCPSYLF